MFQISDPKKSSALKQLGQLEPNFAGMEYTQSFTQKRHFVLISHTTQPLEAIKAYD